jgi:DNA-binding SARP family transcriptional activator/DNA polymerase III delta prime subunit
VEVSVLGAIAAAVDGRAVALGPLKQRMLLAILLCRPGVEVPSDALVHALWEGRPPVSAASNLRSYVHALRRALGKEVISGSGRPGYRLHIDRIETDVAKFDALCAAAEAAAGREDAAAVRDLLREAVALRRDRAFADVGQLPAVADEVHGLEERWLLAMQRCFEAELRLGRGEELVGELTTLIAQHPYRERFWEQLMLALYRAERQSDALHAYQRAWRTLHDELGVEPGPALQAMQGRILDADPALLSAGPRPHPPVPRLAQLPLDVRGFVGRDHELRQLDAALTDTARRPTVIAISAVSGPAGVGKTTLAVHWAHRVVDQFPDGQLYLNLRGFDAEAVRLDAEEALQVLLEALGVASLRIPAGLAARAALYRSRLAGRRMLVVLDNARDDNQVRPLLPGAPGCMVLVTSRNRLTGLIATEGASPVVLDLLDDAGARAALAERIGTDRLLAEPQAVDEIIARCARLPLALAVVAARAVTNPGFSLSALAKELTEVQTPLDAFDGPDPASDIRAVFSSSYRILSVDAARLFRLMGLHPGPHVTTAAAASLAGMPIGTVRRMLAELARAHLLTELRPGRYTFHDLLRAYAVELLEAAEDGAERAVVIRRMLDHYLATAYRAGMLLRPHQGSMPLRPGITPEEIGDLRDAMAWFAVEQAVLLGVIALCHRPDAADPAHHHLAEHRRAIASYLRDSESFRMPNNRYEEATILNNIGDAHLAASDEESARRVWRVALAALEELGHADAEHVRAKTETPWATAPR